MKDTIESYHVRVTKPGKSDVGSMPLGNGDICANVWVEQNGDICLYLSKADAWSEHLRLLKLGKLRVRLTPAPVAAEQFHQELSLKDGMLHIHFEDSQVNIRVWIDAKHPAAHVEISCGDEHTIMVTAEPWRTQPKLLEGMECHSSYLMYGSPEPVWESADVLLTNQTDAIGWYHRNETSSWRKTMDLQSLSELAGRQTDPLLHRTFGVYLTGQGMTRVNDTALTGENSTNYHIICTAYTAQTDSAEEWIKQIQKISAEVEKLDMAKVYEAHRDWWKNFWENSYIFVGNEQQGETVTRGYILQRYLNGCAGRGCYPIKFNGSLFTMEIPENSAGKTFHFDPDYRRWGGPYWFQNTRLTYWPMLAAGDFELMQPFFQMYRDALPLVKYRTQAYYGHGGAFFSETMCFWGTYANQDYGWDRDNKEIGLTDNPYVRFYWSGSLELCVMMLEYAKYHRDPQFIQETLLPIATAVLEFYERHYPRDDAGKIRFAPAASLETWHHVENPLPEIVGVRTVAEGLLEFLGNDLDGNLAARFQQLVNDLPPIPMGEENCRRFLLPAEKVMDSHPENSENPELYAVFPYPLYGIGKPNLDVGLETYRRRQVKDSCGWRQDAVQAACLGLADQAREYVVQNFSDVSPDYAFPAFWGPNFDWVPDQDHGNVASLALQKMLIQQDQEKICLLPAWPREWDVKFRLRAYGNTVVEGSVANGKLEELAVTPSSREKDVINMWEYNP